MSQIQRIQDKALEHYRTTGKPAAECAIPVSEYIELAAELFSMSTKSIPVLPRIDKLSMYTPCGPIEVRAFSYRNNRTLMTQEEVLAEHAAAEGYLPGEVVQIGPYYYSIPANAPMPVIGSTANYWTQALVGSGITMPGALPECTISNPFTEPAKRCTCDSKVLFNFGCKCGGV